LRAAPRYTWPHWLPPAFNPVIRAFYQRLLAAGKAKKVALVACMREAAGDLECDRQIGHAMERKLHTRGIENVCLLMQLPIR